MSKESEVGLTFSAAEWRGLKIPVFWLLVTTATAYGFLHFLYGTVDPDVEASTQALAVGWRRIVEVIILAFLGAAYVLCFIDGYRKLSKFASFREQINLLEKRIDRKLSNNLGSYNEELFRVFGLHQQDGLKRLHPIIDEGEIILKEDIKVVRWMNTKFANWQNVQDTLEKALRLGADIRILLMDPDNPYASDRAKDSTSNYSDPENVEKSVAEYIRDLRLNKDRMIRFVENRRSDLSAARAANITYGSLEVGFYKDSPTIPILIVGQGSSVENLNDVNAYTGFYLDKYSSGLPYIQWHESTANSIFPRVQSYFEKKWHFAEEKHSTNDG